MRNFYWFLLILAAFIVMLVKYPVNDASLSYEKRMNQKTLRAAEIQKFYKGMVPKRAED